MSKKKKMMGELAGTLFKKIGKNTKYKNRLKPIDLDQNDPDLKKFFKSVSKNFILDEEKMMNAVKLRFLDQAPHVETIIKRVFGNFR